MSAAFVTRLDTAATGFAAALDALIRWEASADPAVAAAAERIVDAVRAGGDAALVRFTAEFDRLAVACAADLEVDRDDLAAAFDALPGAERDALTAAAARIRDYHQRQLEAAPRDWHFTDAHGNRLGQRLTPLDRVGVYVPGGKAAYPSTVLMTVLPARVAGVGEIVMTVPTPGGERSALVLAAAHVAGVDRVFTVGGAQAVAALALGTATVPRVDKIVGPGGAFVAAAKRLLYGPVGIDMIAGPSEILIVADGSVPPDWVVLDLFSQAEHDEAAQAILVCPDPAYLDEVAAAIDARLPAMARRDIIRASLSRRGALIRARDLADAVAVANRVAPEHLELAVEDPEALLPAVRHAGAIFLGACSSEAVGDYAAGPSHVLPTSGTARFASPLGVHDFGKLSSIIALSAGGATALGRLSSTLARGEGLEAHALAATARLGINFVSDTKR